MNLAEWLRKIEKKEKLYYLSLFAGFFLFFLIITFPGGAIIDDIIERFNSTSDLNVTYSDLKFSLLSGIKVKDLNISFPSGELSFEKVAVKPSYVKLMAGKLDLHVKVDDPSARINAYVSTGNDFNLNVNVSTLDLSSIPFIEDKLQGTKLQGVIKGKIQLDYPGKWEKSKGLIVAEGKNISISGGPYLGLVGLKSLLLNSLSIMGRINGGKLRLENFNLGDREKFIKMGGNVILKTPLENSLLDLTVKIKLDNELEKKISMFLPTAGFYKSPGGLYIKRLKGRLAFYLR